MTIEKFVNKDIRERLATVKDLPILLEIERSAFPEKRWATEADLQKRLELENSVTWVAFIGDKAAGFTNGFPISDLKTQDELDPRDEVLHLADGKIWLLRNMAVCPEYQGRIVGKKLFQRQIESASIHRASAIRFTTTKEFSAGISSLGFVLIGEPKEFHGVVQGVWELKLR